MGFGERKRRTESFFGTRLGLCTELPLIASGPDEWGTAFSVRSEWASRWVYIVGASRDLEGIQSNESVPKKGNLRSMRVGINSRRTWMLFACLMGGAVLCAQQPAAIPDSEMTGNSCAG